MSLYKIALLGVVCAVALMACPVFALAPPSSSGYFEDLNKTSRALATKNRPRVLLPKALATQQREWPDFVASLGHELPPGKRERFRELQSLFQRRASVSAIAIPQKQGFWDRMRGRPAETIEQYWMSIPHGEGTKKAMDFVDAEAYGFYQKWWRFIEQGYGAGDDGQEVLAHKALESFLKKYGIELAIEKDDRQGMANKWQCMLDIFSLIPESFFEAGLLKTIEFTQPSGVNKGGEYDFANKKLSLFTTHTQHTTTRTFSGLFMHELSHWLHRVVMSHVAGESIEDAYAILHRQDAFLVIDFWQDVETRKHYIQWPFVEFLAETAMYYLLYPDELRSHVRQYAPGSPARKAWETVYQYCRDNMFGGKEFTKKEEIARHATAVVNSAANMLDVCL